MAVSGEACLEAPHELAAGEPRHPVVDQRDVGLRLDREAHGAAAVRCRADDLEPVLREVAADGGRQGRMVVGDEAAWIVQQICHAATSPRTLAASASYEPPLTA